MLLPLDLSKLPDSWMKTIIFGLAPGGVLCIGGALLRMDVTDLFLRYEHLGGVAKAALVGFGVSLTGSMLLFLRTALVVAFYLLGYICGHFAKLSSPKSNSGNRVWRRIVMSCIGPSAVDVKEGPSLSSEEFERRLIAVAASSTEKDWQSVVKAMAPEITLQARRLDADSDWEFLESVLLCFFYKEPHEDIWYALSSAFATSVSFGILAWLSPLSPWLLWSCFTILFIGCVVFCLLLGVNRVITQPQEGILGAQVLKEWKGSNNKA